MTLLFGIILLFIFAAIAVEVINLVFTILMIKIWAKISWKESVVCGWLYFWDDFKSKFKDK